MKQKNSRRKQGKQTGKMICSWLRGLEEGKAITIDGIRIKIEKILGVSLSRSEILSIGNRKRKVLQGEGRFVRRILGQAKSGHLEILGWEYGKENEIEKAKNSGDFYVDARQFKGWIERMALAGYAGMTDHALTNDGGKLAKALTGPVVDKLIEATEKSINKNILLPSETRRTK